MRIGFFVSEVAAPASYAEAVSAHVQIPLYSIGLLRDAGHSVQLITTQVAAEEVWPSCMPAGVTVHQVADARRKRRGRTRVRPLVLATKLRQIKEVVERERYDVLHFHGSQKLPDLAVLLSFMDVKVPFVATVNDALPATFWGARQRLWQRIAAFVTSTEFIRDQLHSRAIRAHVVRHGPVRDIKTELNAAAAQPHRVLFWRDPSIANGIDVCLATFRELAPRFPHISFDAAVRGNHWEDWIPTLRQLAEQYRNIRVHVHPYAKDAPGLAQLLAESICVLLPFRSLSYHPQLSVLESIQFGAPVITTDLGSNVELAQADANATLVRVGDIAGTVAAVARVLSNPEPAWKCAQDAAHRSRAVWNWNNYVEQITEIYRSATNQRSEKTRRPTSA